MELPINKTIEEKIAILKEYFGQKYNSKNITYAIIGSQHLDRHLIRELHSKKIDVLIVSPKQEFIEIYRNATEKNLEEVIKIHHIPSKDDLVDKLVMGVIESARELSKITYDEIYLRDNDSKQYNPIPKNDIIKSQTQSIKKKEHYYRRR
jgi:hypothetical protein